MIRKLKPSMEAMGSKEQLYTNKPAVALSGWRELSRLQGKHSTNIGLGVSSYHFFLNRSNNSTSKEECPIGTPRDHDDGFRALRTLGLLDAGNAHLRHNLDVLRLVGVLFPPPKVRRPSIHPATYHRPHNQPATGRSGDSTGIRGHGSASILLGAISQVQAGDA